MLGLVHEPDHSPTTPVRHSRYVWAYRLVHGKRRRYRRKVTYVTVVKHADTYAGPRT